jgi:hypothetical protein
MRPEAARSHELKMPLEGKTGKRDVGLQKDTSRVRFLILGSGHRPSTHDGITGSPSLFPAVSETIDREERFNCSVAGFEAHIGGWF